MAEFTTNTHRFDPYKNFKFRVKFSGRVVAGVAEVSGLPDAKIAKTKYMKHKQPGLTKYTNVTLKRGVTGDSSFFNWVNGASANKDHKDITIEVFDESGRLVLAYHLGSSWPVKLAASDLNADGSEVAIESIELAHEGIQITNC